MKSVMKNVGLIVVVLMLSACQRQPDVAVIDASGLEQNNATVDLEGEHEAIVIRAPASVLVERMSDMTLGRAPLAEDQAVAIMSYEFWQESAGGDPGIVGKTLSIGGVSYTVIGILPASSSGAIDVWVVAADAAAPVESPGSGEGP